MRKGLFRSVVIAALLLAIALAASYLTVWHDAPGDNEPASQKSSNQELQLVVPQDNWVPIFFQEIDRLTAVANLPGLRTALPGGDMEVRLWFEHGPGGLDALILRKANGAWSARYIDGTSTLPDPRDPVRVEQKQPPRSGWAATWQKLIDAGLLTLPDASEIGCNVNGKDGLVVVVETNVDRIYRTYMYDSPSFAECEQAKQILRLVDIVKQEFSMSWPSTQ